ncbi:conserved exported hypothetical protein [Candidatus Sulfopaludibacter sp. SbA3]|nr:conserved exported hypothetical protein [Candidatus Sulfopaludibacter sp. SbA3]
MRTRLAIAALALQALLAQAPNGPTIPKLTDANPEILDLVIRDQWDRGIDFFGGRPGTPQDKIDWNEVSKRDLQRREAAQKLLADGKLQTGKDYRFAALVLQHSFDSADYMLAHVLAVTAVSKGEARARWLAAATLDRYLMSVKEPQIFGTQFHQQEGVWTQEPYNRTAVADVIRANWCVASQPEQEQILKSIRDGKPFRSTQITDCK